MVPDTICNAIRWGAVHLTQVTETTYLDAEILLANVLQVSRNYFLINPNQLLNASQQEMYINFIQRRSQCEPVAYIIGEKEFWSLTLKVTPDTLIPRPETELLVEIALKDLSADKKTIADLGTGSGAIALALAHERPNWCVYATDYKSETLQVAQQNAQHLGLNNIICTQGDWCQALPDMLFDAIISNPPYIADDDSALSPDVAEYEPHLALFSKQNGLAALETIINTAPKYLKTGAVLFLEHGYQQADAVRTLLKQADYTEIETHKDLSGIERVTRGMTGHVMKMAE